MIKVNNLSIALSHRVLLEPLSHSFKSGQLTVLLGPNGAGKSTLLKAIAGDFPNQQGQILYGSKSINELSAAQRAQYRAVLSQHWHLPFAYSVREVIAMAKPRLDEKILRYYANVLSLSPLLEREYPTLSGGEQQRVQLARALCQLEGQPPENTALLLDEPLSAQDLKQQLNIMKLLNEEARQGRTLIVILHDVQWAALFADHALLLKDGRVSHCGEAATLLTSEHLSQLYDVNMKDLMHPEWQKRMPVISG